MAEEQKMSNGVHDSKNIFRGKGLILGLILGGILAVGISVIAFSEPSQAPPAGNVPAPLNVSATPQTKVGDLTVSTIYAKNLSVAPGVSEYNISNVNTVSGFNDLFLKGNSTETAPLYLAGSEIRAYAGGIERLTITGTGNVGIGSSTPGSKLTVAGIIESISGGFKFPDGSVQTSASGAGTWAVSGANIYNTNSGNVGIGTASPSRAKLETAGMVGNTSALFGLGTQGVSLVSNWPGIAFNSYFKDGVWKSISSGWTGDLSYIASVSPSNGGFVFRTGEWATGPDQIVGHRDVLEINSGGVATFHGPALVMDGVGKGRTDFVMRGDRGSGGRALALDWGNKLVLNWGGDFAGAVEVQGGGLNVPGILCVGGPCRGGVRFQVNGGHIQWGNNSLLATDQGGVIELGGDNTTPGAGIPYIDFHHAGITQDFNARIINDANGKLTVEVPTLYASNNINANDVFIRAAGKWASQMGGGTVNAGSVSSGTFGANTGGGDYVFPSRISSQNRSPTCPNGWGCGVHTWDLYADASIYGTYIHSPNKFFSIPHPLDPQNKILVHATIEGPESAVFYRGEGALINGRAVVALPHYFEALTRKEGRTVLLTDIDGFDPLAVESQNGELVKDGKFIAVSSNKNSSQRFIWEVKAVRADVKPLRVERDKNEPPYDEDQLPAGVKKP